jgi:hypothetical protein
MNSILNQINVGQTIKMDFKISTIKSLMCGWLHIAWQHVANNQDMIKKDGIKEDFYMHSFYALLLGALCYDPPPLLINETPIPIYIHPINTHPIGLGTVCSTSCHQTFSMFSSVLN